MKVCPNCGTDLERFEPMQIGDLVIRSGEIRWMGQLVPVPTACRIMVTTLARAEGVVMKPVALAEAMGCTEETDDLDNIVRVQVCRARRAFRAIDPTFDAIRTVWGEGIRWAA